MRTNQLFLLSALAAVLTTASCSNDEVPGNEPMPVQFTSSVAALSAKKPVNRAEDTTWGSGDAIGIYMVASGTATLSEGAENRQYTTTGSSTFDAATAADAIYYPVDDSPVDFIAYYPHTPGLTNFVYPVDVRTQTPQSAIDLLYSNDATGKRKADTDASTYTSVPLTFSHQLVKLILKTHVGIGLEASDLKGMIVNIQGMNTRCTFDLTTGTFGAAASPDAITPYPALNGEQYEAIVLPATVENTGDIRVEFTITSGETFVWLVPAATAFAAGTKNTFDITITRMGVTVTCIINPWTDGLSDTGVAN